MANQAIENSLSGPRKTPVNGAFGVGLSFLTLPQITHRDSSLVAGEWTELSPRD